MFENVPQKNAPPPGLPGETKLPPATAPAPSDLPSRGPDDIFSETDKSDPSQNVAKPQLLHELKEAKKKTDANLPAEKSIMPVSPLGDLNDSGTSAAKKKYFIIGLVILLFIVAASVGAFLLLRGNGSEFDTTAPTNEAPNINNSPVLQPILNANRNNNIILPPPPIIPLPDPPPPAVPPSLTPPAIQDSDNDGLSDDEEESLGTNPRSADTDSDGLLDKDEVRVYLTDPLDPDTDGDGFSDGQEILNGFNPRGPGKLLEIPQ
jgi:hypothetical protein